MNSRASGRQKISCAISLRGGFIAPCSQGPSVVSRVQRVRVIAATLQKSRNSLGSADSLDCNDRASLVLRPRQVNNNYCCNQVAVSEIMPPHHLYRGGLRR